jgi:hypothetical protein
LYVFWFIQQIAEGLKRSGIGLVSIGLMSDNPKQYADIMQPTEGRNFGDVCSFVIACVESGWLTFVYVEMICLFVT